MGERRAAYGRENKFGLYERELAKDTDRIKELEKLVGKRAEIKNPPGQRTLQAWEIIIAEGMKSHVDAWFALKEIYDNDLFKPHYENFGDYCKDRWGYTQEAYRQLRAAKVCAALTSGSSVTSVVTLPWTTAHANQLAPLLDEPDKLREAWSLALELGKPSFLEVKDIVQGYLPKKETQDATVEQPLVEGEPGTVVGGPIMPSGGLGTVVPGTASPIETVRQTTTPPAAPEGLSPHLFSHLSLDAVLEEAFARADTGDDAIIDDLKWAAWTISRKLLALGYEPFDPKKEEPT